MNDEQNATLERLEEDIRRGDVDGIRARWQSGKELLTLREGKRLPDRKLPS